MRNLMPEMSRVCLADNLGFVINWLVLNLMLDWFLTIVDMQQLVSAIAKWLAEKSRP